MAKKVTKITVGQLTSIAPALLRSWDEHKAKINMRGKILFAFIGLKKDLEKRLAEAQETIALIAEQHDGVFKEEIGGFEIPEEKRAACNKAIDEVVKEEIEIAHTPIVLNENEFLPAEILDAIYDFVEMAE